MLSLDLILMLGERPERVYDIPVKFLIALVAVAVIGFSQSRPGNPDGTPANGWPNLTWQVFPDDQGVYRGCAYFTDSNGVAHFARGITVSLSTYTTQYSGWHGHEYFPATGLLRPQASARLSSCGR